MAFCKYLLVAILSMLILIHSKQSSAAFYIPSPAKGDVADSPIIYTGEHLYQDKTPYNNNYSRYNDRQYTRHYNHPYHNREREARLSLIFGAIGLYFYPLAIPGLVLGIMAADRRNKYYRKAITGIILSSIPIAVGLIILIVVLLTI